MEKHPKAGVPIKVVSGNYKGMIFTPTDFLKNMYQGKQMKNIVKGHPTLFTYVPEEERDDALVFGELYGIDRDHNKVVIHDKHLIKPQEVEHATIGSSECDHQNDVAGGPESDGRSLSGGEVHGENVLPIKQEGQADRAIGSGAGGPEAEHSRPSEPQAGPSEPVSLSEARRLKVQREGRNDIPDSEG